MNTETKTSIFVPKTGAPAEYQVVIRVTDPAPGFEAQLSAVMTACAEASAGRTVHFRRFFLSDAANQAPLLEQALQTLPPVPTSIVHQEPLDGTLTNLPYRLGTRRFPIYTTKSIFFPSTAASTSS